MSVNKRKVRVMSHWVCNDMRHLFNNIFGDEENVVSYGGSKSSS